MNDRLYRSVDDRVIAGVCGGLANRLAIDPSLVRIAYAIVALVTGVFPLLVLYVIMAAIVPEEPSGFAGSGPRPPAPGPDAVPGWAPPGTSAPSPAPGPDAVPGWTPPGESAPWAAAATGWSVAADDAGTGATDAGTGGEAAEAGDTLPGPSSEPPSAAWPAAPPLPTSPTTPAAPAAPQPAVSAAGATGAGGRRERRRNDPLPAVIGGLVLVGLGCYFLFRDYFTVDWGVVWAAGLVAVGVVVVVAAFRPRR
jgi:phage shock protein C